MKYNPQTSIGETKGIDKITDFLKSSSNERKQDNKQKNM